MFSHELMDCLKLINTPIYGVYARDRIPRVIETPAGIIVNTDPHTRPGSHWVAIYIDKNRRADFFDSYGRPPPPDFATFMQRNSVRSGYSNRVLQDVSSAMCGEYCILFLYYRSIGVSMDRFLDLFPTDPKINDEVTDRLFKEFFGKVRYTTRGPQACCSRQRMAHISDEYMHDSQYTF